MASPNSTLWAPTSRAPSSASEGGTTRSPHSQLPSLGPIISIQVNNGSFLQTFYIHENLAVKFSDFLAAAVRNAWKESFERNVKLPEEDPETFQLFEAFVYSGRIYSQQEGDAHVDKDGDSANWEWVRLEELWLLGDRLQAGAFKDAVVDALIEKINSEERVPMKSFERIYAGSARPSPMKELLVEIALREWDTKDIDRIEMDETGIEFVKDLAKAQQKYLTDGFPDSAPYSEGPTCIYHEHGWAKHCYKTMFS